MTDIDELTQKVARHLAGRDVLIRWQNPPSESAAGQIVKTADGQLVIYIADLTDLQSRFKTYLHELSHARLDAGWIPKSSDHLRRSASIKMTPEKRQRWRSSWREKRASELSARWLEYAETNAYKYWRVGRSEMETRLLSLMDWKEH